MSDLKQIHTEEQREAARAEMMKCFQRSMVILEEDHRKAQLRLNRQSRNAVIGIFLFVVSWIIFCVVCFR